MTQPDTHRLVCLDYAATTPVRPDVREAMEPFLREQFGNPSSAHRFGRAARSAVDQARRQIAAAIGAKPSDVVFTSGGTEADNLAVIGAALAARTAGGPFRVAVSAIEHKAVIEAAEAVEHLGGEAIMLPVDATGRIDLDAVDSALQRGIALLSVIWVNNEVGVLQDIPQLAGRAAAAGIPFHTDAVQAIGKVACDIAELPVALLSISGHKIGAPKGVGALIVRDGNVLEPLLHGGGQQMGIRPGTENVPGAVALGVAVSLATGEREQCTDRMRRLRDELEHRLTEVIPDAHVNAGDAHRAPHISNICIPGTDSESMVMHLDLAGIACAAGSACATETPAPSHVLTAMGAPVDVATASLRFSLSASNTAEDVDRVVDVMPGVVKKVRRLTETLRR